MPMRTLVMLVLFSISLSAAESTPTPARHVSFTLPTVVLLAAGTEDMLSTVSGASHPEAGCLVETNPLIAPFSAHPVVMVAVGAVEEVAAFSVLHHWLAP